MVANVPLDLLDRLRAVEDKLRQIEGRTQIRPALNSIVDGVVSVGAGGEFKVLDTDGSVIMWVGGIAPAHTDGSPQRGVLFYREDGSMALSISTSGPEPQGLSMRDRAGSIIVAEDVATGGIARPYISTDAWIGATAAPTDTTTSASFTTLQNMPGWNKQHPKITANFLVQTAATTAGEIRLVDDSNNVIAGPLAVAANQFFYGALTGPIPGAFGSVTGLHWQARVTSGTGTIGVRGLATYGVQT